MSNFNTEMASAIRMNLNSLEEGRNYYLSLEYTEKVNARRVDRGYGEIQFNEYVITVVDGILFVNKQRVIIIDDIEDALTLTFAFAFAFAFVFAGAVAFAFAGAVAFAFAFADGELVDEYGLLIDNQARSQEALLQEVTKLAKENQELRESLSMWRRAATINSASRPYLPIGPG